MKLNYNFLNSKIIFVLFFFISIQSFGNKVGNGGDGVFCETKHPMDKKHKERTNKEISMLLEFYENKIQSNTNANDY